MLEQLLHEIGFITKFLPDLNNDALICFRSKQVHRVFFERAIPF